MDFEAILCGGYVVWAGCCGLVGWWTERLGPVLVGMVVGWFVWPVVAVWLFF